MEPQMDADERRLELGGETPDFGWNRVRSWNVRTMDMLGWPATVLAVIGVLLNNFQLWPCFVFWMLSNGLSAWIHRTTGPRSLMVRDLIFFALACVGLWQWTR